MVAPDENLPEIKVGREVVSLDLTALLYAVNGNPPTLDAVISVQNFIAQIVSGGVGGGGDVVRTKYIISPSIVSNNLVFSIKYIDGNDCTASNKLTFRVGNTEYDLTAAISFTKNAGINFCNLGGAECAALPHDLFVYAIGETGASAGLKFGYSRISTAKTMGDFVNITTSNKYIAGNWTNFNSTDPVTVIGRFQAQLSAGAGYTWSIPSSVVINYPIYETDWHSWTPVHTGFTATIPSGGAFRYQLRGTIVQLNYSPNTPGISNATNYLITTPFIAKNIANYNQWFALGFTYDDGAGAPSGIAQALPNTNSLTITKSAGAAWTASGQKLVNFMLIVEIE